MSNNWTLGLIGTGNMGSALVRGVIDSKLLPPDNIHLFDIDAEKASHLALELHAHAAATHAEVLDNADTVVLASKPQDIHKLLNALVPVAKPHHLFISIAAGIPTQVIEQRLGKGSRVVRVMPNTPAMVGCGASGVAKGSSATPEDMARALSIFGSFGVAVEVEEQQIDAVTGLSGSGPAYVFYLIEAMIKAGEQVGLSREAAAALTNQTVLGAARMVIETKTDPAELRRRVTSPHGTTEAGIRVMREGDFSGLIERAVTAATERGHELGKMFD